MEAIRKIEVENFPAFIVVDDKGNDFFVAHQNTEYPFYFSPAYNPPMDPTPENLAKLRRERIDRARKMTPEQKITAGPRLFTLAIECMRAGIRLQTSDATEAQIREIIRQRLQAKRRCEDIAFFP